MERGKWFKWMKMMKLINTQLQLHALSKDEFVDIFGTLVDVLFGGDDTNGGDTLR